MRPVLAALGYGLSIRMVLVIHMAFAVLGMMEDSISCCRQIGTGIHLADMVNMKS